MENIALLRERESNRKSGAGRVTGRGKGRVTGRVTGRITGRGIGKGSISCHSSHLLPAAIIWAAPI